MTLVPRRIRTFYRIAPIALTTIGIVRIILTYPFFFQTADEPNHIACGMLWMEGAYPPNCIEHPPLARIASAIPLRVAGIRAVSSRPSMSDNGSVLLRSGGTYERNLALARCGTMLFFIVASLIVWVWSRRLFGDWPALAALFLFQGLPPVLAHASLATTDMAVTAFLPVAVFVFVEWLERPSAKRSVFLGITVGIALLAKFSALLFLPAGALLILLVWYAAGRSVEIRSWWAARRFLGLLATAILLTFLVVWAGYRFSRAALTKPADRPHRIGRLLGVDGLPPRIEQAFFRVVEMPVPARDFLLGVEKVRTHNASGHSAYFLGELRQGGWWYYFPLLVALKSPFPFLILLMLGCGYVLLEKSEVPIWKRFSPLLGAVAILVVSAPARINIGLRHVLPVYVPFAMVAGVGLARLVSAPHWRTGSRLLALGLAAWFAVASARAHPDYLAYFNELAGPRPEEIVADSDLDWGQDVKRLMTRARSLGIQKLWYRCLGCRYLGEAGLKPLPEFPRELFRLSPYEAVTGWVAIDEWALKTEGESERRAGEKGRAFDWLEAYPFERIGKSIRLYHVPPKT